MATVGTVVAKNGEAFVVNESGVKKTLQLGDTVQLGDTIITPPGIIVELRLVNGKTIEISSSETVKFTHELVDFMQPDSSDSAVDQATIQTVIKAIEEGRDINEVIEETAAGLNGGGDSNSYGFSFVDLLRIDEVLNAFHFEFDRVSQNSVNSQQAPEVGGQFTTALLEASSSVSTTNNPGATPTITVNSITADNIVNAAEAGGSVNVTGTVGGGAKVGDTVTLSINGQTYTGLVTAGNTYSIAVAGSDLAASTGLVVSVATINAAGITATASTAHSYAVDTVASAPTVALTTDSGSSSSDGISKVGTLSVSGIEAGASVQYSIDGGTSWSPGFTATEGTNTVQVRQIDVAGNVSAASSISFTLDTTPPAATLSLAAITADNIITASEAGGSITVSGSVSGEYTVGDSVTLSIGAGTYTASVGIGGGFSVSVPGSVLAAHSLVSASLTTTDTAGNSSTVTASHSYDNAPVAIDDTASVTESGVNPGNTSFAGTPSATGNVLTNDTDVDIGDTKTVSAVNGAAGNVGVTLAGTYGTFSIASDGTYTYTLNNADTDTNALAQGATGTDVFTYTVRDASGATSTANLTITVTGTNDAPVAVADSVVIGSPSLSANGNVLTNDTDVDTGDTKIVSAVNGAGGNVGSTINGSYGTIQIAGDGSYVYNVDPLNPAVLTMGVTDSLTDTFAYTVQDANGATSSTNLTVTITGLNQAPTVVADTAAVQEDGTTTAIGNVLANDNDPNNDILTVSQVNGVAGNVGSAVTGTYGSVSIAANGAYIYTLNNAAANVQALGAGQTVTDVFTYTASDGNGGTASTSLTVTVTGTNDAAVISGTSSASIT
ncbi:MAG: retention module-containing protein, partial [Methylophilaceae bacterium]